MQQLVKEG